jgi:hypothetical protein
MSMAVRDQDGGARRCTTLQGELWVRDADLDIHQAEGGARIYWRPGRASLEVFGAKVAHSEDNCANLGHGAVSPDS